MVYWGAGDPRDQARPNDEKMLVRNFNEWIIFIFLIIKKFILLLHFLIYLSIFSINHYILINLSIYYLNLCTDINLMVNPL